MSETIVRVGPETWRERLPEPPRALPLDECFACGGRTWRAVDPARPGKLECRTCGRTRTRRGRAP